VDGALSRQPILLLIRLIMGGILIASSVAKLSSGTDFVGVVSSYGLLPQFLAELYGSVLPWLELLIGVLLILASSPGSWQPPAPCWSQFHSSQRHALLAIPIAPAPPLRVPGKRVPSITRGHWRFDVLMLAMALLLPSQDKDADLGIIFLSRLGACVQTGPAHSLPANINHALFAMLMLLPSPLLIANQKTSRPCPGTVESIVSSALKNGQPLFFYGYLETCSHCQKQKPIVID